MLTPESWHQVKDALHQAMQLQAEHRAAYLAQLSASDPDLSAQVESLLAASDELQEDFLNVPAVAALNESTSPDPMVGQRLGPYQLLQKIGAGGMGEVYRAIRADDEYRHTVAIKLVHAEFASSPVLARLRQERQILASLDHPNITRLLDGGRTTQGVPYLVMDLIDGEPIHRFCEQRGFDTEQKLRLFVKVCLAVHYAHQRLIIHRDIKPGNILVTPAGVPKLLDFGIAKILDPTLSGEATGPMAPTATIVRLYTPGYASPEQLKGEPITTSTDVYSLGVVLRELLSASAPGQEGKARALDLNLDYIVRMATRPEADKRYSSAEALATDINRHLEHLPVIARRNTLKYRLSTFMARHTSAIAASLLLAVALVAATVISLHEAQAARTERARAERRFNDARRLANSLMREIYGSIKDLPGATAARKLLVNKALEYLDGLSGDALSDPALEQELAIAYSLVGDVQGNPYYANLGDPTGALENYRKALEIRLRLSGGAPADVHAVRAVAGSYNQIGTQMGVMRDFSAAVTYFEVAGLLLERVDRDNRDALVMDQLAGTYYYLAEAALRAGNPTLAADSIRRASAIRDSIVSANSAQSRLIRTHSAADHSAAAQVLAAQKKYPEAAVEQRKAIDIVSGLAADQPGDATLASYVGEGFDYLGRIQEYLDDRSGALASYRHASQILEPIMAVDPQNTFVVSLVAHSYERMGMLEAQGAGSRAAGSLMIAKAIKLISPLSEQFPTNTELRAQVAYAYSELGDAEKAESMRPAEALRRRERRQPTGCVSYRKSLDVWLDLQRRGSLDAFEKTADVTAEARKKLEQCEDQLTQAFSALTLTGPAVARSKRPRPPRPAAAGVQSIRRLARTRTAAAPR